MKRALGWITLSYLPHLLEEALTGMHDDPIIVAGWAVLSRLDPRHASYLVFQSMLVLTLITALAWSRGVLWQRVVIAVLSLAMLAESHHLLRALWSASWNSGLATSLPMPFIGALALRASVHLKTSRASRTSPWAPSFGR